MLKTNKKYTEEFKKEAIKLVLEHGYSQCEAARSLGISDKNINRWVMASKVQKNATKQQKTINADEELLALRKENARLKLEKEILKKAAAFFAKECHNDMHL